ncbi:cation-translocating P-type ATPase [Fodinicola acaciae]|uniref:cation-translocating P-type ATPase n=1 Tax=Fodinicola acaciae TaxID=2681555 RepID=UPI0013D22D1A|nr:cation-transporting P-type ATPase [Fodinicola acaciae]
MTVPDIRSASGLTAAEVAARMTTCGPNVTAEPPRRRGLASVVNQLTDPLSLLLIAAMVLTVALRDVTDLIVIALVIVLNTTVGTIQEIRADHAVTALRSLAAPVARVRRDGLDQRVPTREVVPGDLVALEAGDIVPADVDVVEAVRLQVNEAALTGEPAPVAKLAGDAASAGTVVVAGRGRGVVTRTGAASALGRIATLVATEPIRRTPLQRRLATLSWYLGVVAVTLSGLVLVAGLLRGEPLAEMVIAAVSLTVAAVPESLPAVITVALAIGARRMARRAAIARSLPAVETLGAVTVLAMDKTGTVTEGRMAVTGFVTASGTRVDIAPASDAGVILDRLALDIQLCNDADPSQAIGDPTEVALATAAEQCGVPVSVREWQPRIAEVPFEATNRRMTTVHSGQRGLRVVCKGAPESVLRPEVLVDDPTILASAAATAHRLAADGYRVLAVADRELPVGTVDPHNAKLRFAGLVLLVDPLRPEARVAVESFLTAGVRPVLITGDHPATATAIADQLGLPPGAIATGGGTGIARVYARTHPEQKLDIVRALQERGEIVAMTGDGVNDAPALRRADIGVAMGKTGTEAARQAADLVLADDNLGTVTAAIEEGRRIYANVRRFLGFGLSGGLAELAVMIVGPFLGLGLPLLPAQILWINMLTHGLPGVALGVEPADPQTMRQPPRPAGEAILAAGLWRTVLAAGSCIAAMSLVAAVVAAAWAWPWQSILFLTLCFGQLGIAWSSRARAHAGRHRWLVAAIGLSLTLQLAGIYLPPLRFLLGTQPLDLTQLGFCLIAGIIPGLLHALLDTRS